MIPEGLGRGAADYVRRGSYMSEHYFQKWLTQRILNGDALLTAKDALDSLEAEKQYAQAIDQSFDDHRWSPIEKSLRRYPENWTIVRIAEAEDREQNPLDTSRDMRKI